MATVNTVNYLRAKEEQANNLRVNQLGRDTLDETKRSNIARETETNRANVARETEENRSNVARETETHRANVAKETENNRHNVQAETTEATKVRNQGYKDRADASLKVSQAYGQDIKNTTDYEMYPRQALANYEKTSVDSIYTKGQFSKLPTDARAEAAQAAGSLFRGVSSMFGKK